MICYICEEDTESINYHHTVPRCVGGEDSEQVPLSANCHDGVHRELNRMMSRYRKHLEVGAPKWRPSCSAGEYERACKVIQIGLRATIEFEDSGSKVIKMTLELPSVIHAGLNQLKRQGGMSTLPETAIECIRYALKVKGINTERRT
jgi:hypothetical protein